LRSFLVSIDALLIVSSLPVPDRLKKSVTKKVNFGSFG
jgi:hypothetical protein